MNTLPKCWLCCTAYSYDIERIVAFLEKNNEHFINFEDALYTRISIAEREIDLFLFSFGCFVAWDAAADTLPNIMHMFQDFSANALERAINDFVYFDYSQLQALTIDEEKNAIFLQDKTVFLKLSVSYALAQSVKLTYLEQSVKQMLESTNPIRETLAATGRVNLSKQDLSKQIGSLFNERYSINLHSDILDTPEFFWRKPSYEPLYLMAARFQDIEVRHDILNHRLDMIHELYSILSNELNYKHSTRLEVAVVFLEVVVVLLIALEVVLGVLKMK